MGEGLRPQLLLHRGCAEINEKDNSIDVHI